MTREDAIKVSLDTWNDRLNLKYPFYKEEYEDLFSEEEFKENYKCGLCIINSQKCSECSECEFGYKFGMCAKEDSLYGKNVGDIIYDNEFNYECIVDYSEAEIKNHKEACQNIINALESMKRGRNYEK